jgi:hypothetical protein
MTQGKPYLRAGHPTILPWLESKKRKRKEQNEKSQWGVTPQAAPGELFAVVTNQ